MDKDDLWVVEHFSELVTKYAGKYIAVVNESLVAVGDSGKEVEDKARAIAPETRVCNAHDPCHDFRPQNLGLCRFWGRLYASARR
jgi:hypothetical protein